MLGGDNCRLLIGVVRSVFSAIASLNFRNSCVNWIPEEQELPAKWRIL